MAELAVVIAGITPQMELAGLAAVSALLSAAAIMIVSWKRRNPRERERRRRLAVHRHGRMGDGMIIDCHEDALYYTYSVRGVEYAASQDISALREYLPANPALLIGPVTLKYSPKNPANSILVCEEWSGLRRRPARPDAEACRAAAAGASE